MPSRHVRASWSAPSAMCPANCLTCCLVNTGCNARRRGSHASCLKLNNELPFEITKHPSGFRMLAYTGASNGNTTAGTTSHGCNSICSPLPTRMDRLSQSSDTR